MPVATAIPAWFSDWLRSDFRWMWLAGWVSVVLLVIAVFRLHKRVWPTTRIRYSRCMIEGDVVRLEVINDGPPTSYAARLTYLGLPHEWTVNLPLRWATDPQEFTTLRRGEPEQVSIASLPINIHEGGALHGKLIPDKPPSLGKGGIADPLYAPALIPNTAADIHLCVRLVPELDQHSSLDVWLLLHIQADGQTSVEPTDPPTVAYSTATARRDS